MTKSMNMFLSFGITLEDYSAQRLSRLVRKMWYFIISYIFWRLCPSNYLSAPALSWHAILNMTNVEIKVISDRDRICSLEKVMRGGVSYISKRFSKATIFIWNVMIQSKNQGILYKKGQIIYMVMQCLSFFQ